jgi:hypothetical protein
MLSICALDDRYSAPLQEQAQHKPRYTALKIVDGHDTSSAGPDPAGCDACATPSVSNPARTAFSRTVRSVGMLLGLAGFIAFIVAHSVVGFRLLVTSVIIFIWQSVSCLRQRRTARTQSLGVESAGHRPMCPIVGLPDLNIRLCR